MHDPGIFQYGYSQSNHHKQDSKLRGVRFLIVWSNLNHFLIQQPAATNSMHVQSTHNPHSKHLQSDLHLESDWKSVVEHFRRNSLHVKAVDCFLRGAPLLMFDGVLNASLSEEKISTAGVARGNLELLLPPNSPASKPNQTQIQEDEILDWLHGLISLKENSPLNRQGKKRLTNSWAATHQKWMLRCSPHAPSSQSNKQIKIIKVVVILT